MHIILIAVLLLLAISWLFSNWMMGIGSIMMFCLIPYWMYLRKRKSEGEFKAIPGLQKAMVLYVLIAVVTFGFGYRQKDADAALAAKQQAEKIAADASAPICKNNWKLCNSNQELMDNYKKMSSMQARCQTAAAREARYGSPKWPWLPFGTYLSGSDYARTGRALLIEPDAQFQNGFGAQRHVEVRCLYDLNRDEVISVSVGQG